MSLEQIGIDCHANKTIAAMVVYAWDWTLSDLLEVLEGRSTNTDALSGMQCPADIIKLLTTQSED